MAHRFDPRRADRLLDQGRREWHDPELVLRHLNLGERSTLADIGCGPGWFALAAAERLEPGGRVLGIDVSAEMLQRLAERAGERGLANVVPVLAEEEDEWPVPTAVCDAALIANVYHEADPASLFIGEVKRILQPGATCLLVDWKPEATPVGPPLAERVDPQDVVAEFTAVGFHFAGACDVGPYTYGLKFQRA